MSALVWLPQRSACHILVDAASYFESGIVADLIDKCRAIPELHCAMTTLGPVGWQQIIFDAIREGGFSSFDDLVTGFESLMVEVFEYHQESVSSLPCVATEVWIAGWSQRRQRPEGYTIWLEDRAEFEKRRLSESTGDRNPFEIRPLSNVAVHVNPTPTGEALANAFFRSGVLDTEVLIPEVDLLHIMEIQRHWPFDDGKYKIGGYALLTSIDESGVTQRRIQEWPEDKVGELIRPKPIDWVRWRADREPPSPNVTPMPALNRQQRRQLKAARR
jgi:hypothetical protein